MNHKTKEAFLDVLLYLFEYYSDEHETKQNSEPQIRNELVIAGFQEEMIEHAMEWVAVLISLQITLISNNQKNSQ